MSELFDEYEHWTKEGKKLYAEINQVARPIIEKWYDRGYKGREIQSIAHDIVAGTLVFLKERSAMIKRISKDKKP